MSFRDVIETGNGNAIPDNVVLANSGAWHRTGTVLDTNGEKGLTVEQALPASGLDFTVVKTPVFGAVPKMRNGNPVLDKDGKQVWVAGPAVERRYGVVRTDTNLCLGVVGETWEPMQPLDGFQVINDVIEQAGGKACWIETAGTIDSGRKIWILAHIDTELQIAGESYRSYLLFTTGFDGKLSTTAAAVDVRTVCANTLNYAIFGEAKETGYVVRVRHTKKAAERIKEAHAILGMRHKRAEDLAKQGEWLVEQQWDEGSFNNFLEMLMPVPDGQEDKPAETMINKRRDQVREIYFQESNLNSIRGTAWGAHQAVLEYADHGRKFADDESQTKAQLGMTRVGIKQDSYDLVMALSMAE